MGTAWTRAAATAAASALAAFLAAPLADAAVSGAAMPMPESIPGYVALCAGRAPGIALSDSWWAYPATALAAAAALSSLAPKGRGGELGSQSAVADPGAILRANPGWDGRSEPQDGVVVGWARGKAVVVPCVHAAVCAPSGSGKTRGSLYPTLDALTFSGRSNVVVTDPSLEIFLTAAPCLRERGYEVLLLDLEEPRQGSRYNPLAMVARLHREGDAEGAEARARELGAVLFPASGGEDDIFANAAAGAFAAVAWLVSTLGEVPEESRTLASVARTVLGGTAEGPGALKGWLRSFGPESPAAAMAATFLASEGKLESSVAATLHDGLQPFTSAGVSWLTSGGELDVDRAVAGRTAVFLRTLAPGMPANRVASLFLAQHWAAVRRLGKGRSLRPCWVLGDEWHSVPRFPLVHAVEQSRKYGLHYVMYLQSFSGLDQYRTRAEDGKDAILSNCDLKALYKAGSEQDARYFEALGGSKTVMAASEGRSFSPGGRGRSEGASEQRAPVWPAGDVVARDPSRDGALVFRAASGGRPSGKFEVPVRDVSGTFVARHFGTLGTPEFERESMARQARDLEERASSAPQAPPAWAPEFESPAEDIADDEFAAWD